jgi:hypothetical protein
MIRSSGRALCTRFVASFVLVAEEDLTADFPPDLAGAADADGVLEVVVVVAPFRMSAEESGSPSSSLGESKFEGGV